MPAFSAHPPPSATSLTTIRENLCLGFTLIAGGFCGAALGAEFPLVLMLFVWGGVVPTYAVKGHMELLEAQRHADTYESAA